MTFSFHPEADDEFREAIGYYETCQRGLGEEFYLEVHSTIERHGGVLLRRVRLFDLYRGTPLAATEKSLAYRLVLGAKDRTLTEAEVDAAIVAVRKGLEVDLDAHLRT